MELLKNELGEKVALEDILDTFSDVNKSFQLKSLIAVYLSDRSHIFYNEVYQVEGDSLSGPYMITESDIHNIAQSAKSQSVGVSMKVYASDFLKSKSGNQLLSFNPEKRSISWIQPQRIGSIRMKSISKSPFEVTIPNLFFEYSSEGIRMFALSQKFNLEKTKNRTIQFYKSPFPNVWDKTESDADGNVCLGSVKININYADTISEAIDIIDHSFWKGEFTSYHMQEQEERFLKYFQNCFNSKVALPFPYKSLQKSHKYQL